MSINSGVTLDELSADAVTFDNTGKKFVSTYVDAALDELRNKEIHSIEKHTTTLNGSDSITASSETIHIADGTATGYSFILPDATSLFNGRRYEVVNESSETISLKDDGGTTLATLIAGDIVTATLENNTTTDGVWILTITSSSATGIVSEVVTSDVAFATTSPTDVVITGFTVTPVTGRYSVFYSAELTISVANKVSEMTIYVAGVAISNTMRQVKSASPGFETGVQTIGEVTVNGSEAVDVRVNTDGGTLTIDQRSLILIRLGS